MSSIIQFIMPADQLAWAYGLDFDTSNGFEGQTSVLVENVTQGQSLLTLSDSDNPPDWVETTLDGTTGDLIRITTEMSGSGNVPADIVTFPSYTRFLRMYFDVVPEPATLAFLGLGGLFTLRRRRRG